MTITTELGSWAYITQTASSMRESIISSLGDYADDFDVDGLEEAVREQIDTMLAGVRF